MDMRVVVRLFERFQEKGFVTDFLNKEEWLKELSCFGNNLQMIKFGLQNIKDDLPTAKQFVKMCSPLYSVERHLNTYDGKQWARDILANHQAGRTVRPICLTFAKEALRMKGNHE